MFEILKDRLFPGQQELPEKILEDKSNFDLSAGAALLESYKNSWKVLHNENEGIAKVADRVEKLSRHTSSYFDNQWKNMVNLNSYFSQLPDIAKDLQAISQTIESLGSMFQDLEKSLIDLENIIEIQDLQKKQNNEKFQLVLYKDRRNFQHNNVKSVMSSNYNLKVEEHEKKHNSLLAERRVAFEKAFEDDLQHYVKFGKVEKVQGLRDNGSELKLEDVNFEEENDELGAFLDDEYSTNIPNDVQ